VVSLHGAVANEELRDALGLAVSEMHGVEGVNNSLRVR
jgi:osmotically-inducible protein OsmY